DALPSFGGFRLRLLLGEQLRHAEIAAVGQPAALLTELPVARDGCIVVDAHRTPPPHPRRIANRAHASPYRYHPKRAKTSTRHRHRRVVFRCGGRLFELVELLRHAGELHELSLTLLAHLEVALERLVLLFVEHAEDVGGHPVMHQPATPLSRSSSRRARIP